MADLNQLKNEIMEKREALRDVSEISDVFKGREDVQKVEKLSMKNRRVLKGHFAKIYAMQVVKAGRLCREWPNYSQ